MMFDHLIQGILEGDIKRADEEQNAIAAKARELRKAQGITSLRDLDLEARTQEEQDVVDRIDGEEADEQQLANKHKGDRRHERTAAKIEEPTLNEPIS